MPFQLLFLVLIFTLSFRASAGCGPELEARRSPRAAYLDAVLQANLSFPQMGLGIDLAGLSTFLLKPVDPGSFTAMLSDAELAPFVRAMERAHKAYSIQVRHPERLGAGIRMVIVATRSRTVIRLLRLIQLWEQTLPEFYLGPGKQPRGWREQFYLEQLLSDEEKYLNQIAEFYAHDERGRRLGEALAAALKSAPVLSIAQEWRDGLRARETTAPKIVQVFEREVYAALHDQGFSSAQAAKILAVLFLD